jgi:hypothetical protein
MIQINHLFTEHHGIVDKIVNPWSNMRGTFIVSTHIHRSGEFLGLSVISAGDLASRAFTY